MELEQFNFKKTWDYFVEIHKGILSQIDPSKKIKTAKLPSGFTEANLTVNFAKAYENIFENSFTWYEWQFSEKGSERNDCHYDAVIIDNENSRILIIESKMLKTLRVKIPAIADDVNRINNANSNNAMDGKFFDKKVSSYDIYGVILAETWDTDYEHNAIISEFKNGSFVNNPKLNINNIPQDAKYFTASNFKHFSNYTLLSFYWKVK